MTRQEILNSIPLKKRFVKDCGLPISIYKNPYFYERVQSLDVIYGSIEKFDRFCCQLSTHSSEQEYFEAYNLVKESAISCIKNSELFRAFIEEDFHDVHQYPKRNLYIDENDDATFISIDMKKANFSALHHYASRIFNNCNTWEDYIGQFTDNSHIINSKYVRQVILGACNPKKQIQYERYLITILCNWIVDNIPSVNIYSLRDDEIIIQTPKEYGVETGYSLSRLKQVVNSCPNKIGLLVRVQEFDLFKIRGTNSWRKVWFEDGERQTEFKCLDSDTIHQVIKYYYGKSITENDLVFVHNGELAAFLKPIKNPFN